MKRNTLYKSLVILIIGLLLSLSACEKKQDDDIYIFFTSDVHCGVSDNLGYPSIKAIIDETKQEHNYVSLVDIGDNLQGSTLGGLSKGKLVIDVMNEMGYDFSILGNHDFDYGTEELSKRMKEANFDYIISNMIYSGNKENLFKDYPEYIIKEYGGTKVGFIGLATPETITSSTPSHFMEDGNFVYNFYSGNNGQDLYDKTQSLVDEMRSKGAKYVVALTHLGSNIDSAPYDSISLISNTSGIDVVLDGHSHSIIIGDKYPNKNGEDVILSSVGTKLEALGELIISKEGEISTLHITEYDKQDENIIAVIEKANNQVNNILSEKIIDLGYGLDIKDEEGIRISRNRECALGNLAADAFRYEAKSDIAMLNGGGLRSGIEEGEITMNDIYNVFPFQNNLALIKVSGQEILDCLEFGSKNTEKLYKFDGNAVGEFGGFIHVSGLRYTIDTSIESSVILDDDGMFVGFANDNRRVKSVFVLEGDEYVPIDPNKIYTVSGIDYLLVKMGDGNNTFENANVLIQSGELDIDVIKDYLLNNDISEMYKDIEGRITIE